MGERLLTPPEVADLLRVSVQELADMRYRSRAGECPLPWVTVGRRVRYERADVVRYIASRKRESTKEAAA